MKELLEELNVRFSLAKAEEILEYFTQKYPGRVSFATSLGMEDQVITHMLSRIAQKVHFFTLDTGRLFPETYELIDLTQKKYKIDIHLYFPGTKEVEEMVAEKGINLFYESVENRKLCCEIRKLQPLERALAGMKIWINGLRRSQSHTRADLNPVEWDETHQVMKVNPLISWTDEAVLNYIKTHQVPYNPLHDQGFTSIGCQPCTRAILPGEDIRAGRWWWELPQNRECGLHTHNKSEKP